MSVFCSLCHSPTVWPNSSGVRVIAHYARGSGFDSWSGCAFSSPVTFGSLVAQCGSCSGCEHQKDCLFGSGMVQSRFGDESIRAGGNCHILTVWPYSSVVGVLAQSARGPGFETLSLGRVVCLFLACDTYFQFDAF